MPSGSSAKAVPNVRTQSLATAVPGLPPVAVIAAGDDMSAALSADNGGTLWTWGNGKQGQMGNGLLVAVNATPRGAPAPAAGLWSGSGPGVYLPFPNGNVFAWGSDQYGELGVGPVLPALPWVKTPVQVVFPPPPGT
jgi:alpha-tubulin suppressor-like RCC1 family protein